MRSPVEIEHLCIAKRVKKGAQLYRILNHHAIKLTFLHHLPMVYQHTMSALKSKYLFTTICRKRLEKIVGKLSNIIYTVNPLNQLISNKMAIYGHLLW